MRRGGGGGRGRGRSRAAWVVAAGLILTGSLGPAPAEAQSWRTVTMSRQAGGSDNVDVTVRYGAGRLRVGTADPGLLYRMRLHYDEELFEPVADYRPGRLELGVDAVSDHINIRDRDDAGELELYLGRDVPMDLNLEFGAVRANLDLGGLSLTGLKLVTGAAEARLDISRPNPSSVDRAEIHVGAAEFTADRLGNLNARRIEVKAGVGDVTLDFGGEWRRDARVKVDMALGALELRFPRGLGVHLVKDSFLTALDAQEMVKRGDDWYSLDWETADRKITVEVDAAFGGIDVVWTR